MNARLLALVLIGCAALPARAQISATFVSQSGVPATVAAGATFDATVVFRNDGSSAWPARGLLLAASGANSEFWIAMAGGGGGTAPGASASFSIRAYAPRDPATLNFQLQLYQEQVPVSGLTPPSSIAVGLGAPIYLSPRGGQQLPSSTTSVLLRFSSVRTAGYYRIDVSDLDGHPLSSSSEMAPDHDTPAPISLTVSAGQQFLWTVTAFDWSGHQQASETQWFGIQPAGPDTQSPQVFLHEPRDGDTVRGRQPITVATSDNIGVQELDFWVDGTRVGELRAAAPTPSTAGVLGPPFSVVWDSTGFADGPHRVMVMASDAAGNTTATSIHINVANASPPSCLMPSSAGSDDVAINSRLAWGFPGMEIVLCPNQTYSLSRRIAFTADGQQLYTRGFPTDASRARLVAAFPNMDAVIRAGDHSHLKLRNVQIDGSRGTNETNHGWALIEWGGGSNNFVDQIKAFDPLGWSILADDAGCTENVITNSQIGPSGHSRAGQWADGLSLGCRNSLVDGNQIVDATDGAIVLFGASGSRISNNTIRSLTHTLLGGIDMVDFDPVAGNFTGTVVWKNLLSAETATMKTGIGMGTHVGGCDVSDQRNVGATVQANTAQGARMGFSFPLNGVWDWTVGGNVDLATHVGTARGCGPGAPAPGGFQVDGDAVDPAQAGRRQSDYVQSVVQATAGLVPWDADPELVDGVALSGLSGSPGSVRYFSMVVPPGLRQVTFTTSGGSGDSDLYVQLNGAPELPVGGWLCRPYTSSTNESCPFPAPVPGTYYVMVRGYTDYAGVSLVANFTR